MGQAMTCPIYSNIDIRNASTAHEKNYSNGLGSFVASKSAHCAEGGSAATLNGRVGEWRFTTTVEANGCYVRVQRPPPMVPPRRDPYTGGLSATFR